MRYAAADLNQDGEKADSPFETLMSHLFPCKPAKMTGWDLLEQKTWGYMEDTERNVSSKRCPGTLLLF